LARYASHHISAQPVPTKKSGRGAARGNAVVCLIENEWKTGFKKMFTILLTTVGWYFIMYSSAIVRKRKETQPVKIIENIN